MANLFSGLQKMKAMDVTLSKASKVYPDCSALASKLRAQVHNAEEQLRAQQNQASYLTQLTARTFSKGLHCLSMRLTTEFFTLKPEEKELLDFQKVHEPDLYHYAIFSDNVLACAVAVNSTTTTSMVKHTTSTCILHQPSSHSLLTTCAPRYVGAVHKSGWERTMLC